MKVALAGDTMLGRGVAAALAELPSRRLVAPEVAEVAGEADLFVLNLECCISERGQPSVDPSKPFVFRAPPAAAETLAQLGVDCVTLANNHTLDFGVEAFVDTLEHLRAAGIACVGAGRNVEAARARCLLRAGGLRLAIVGVSDHPPDYAASVERPGIAYADLRHEPVPAWLLEAVRRGDADAVLVTPHWGPNMTSDPVPHVRRTAAALVEAGATLVAGHSAHVFHGVAGRVLYDLGDFLDDYAVDPLLRNDLGLLFLVTLDRGGPHRLEAVPLKLEYAYTRLAVRDDADWIRRRFRTACASLGTEVTAAEERLIIEWPE
jgi:poly-gamma-glutamate capsule biosynthesis protein CapA/YwtB (metallophosphatase superfamily)